MAFRPSPVTAQSDLFWMAKAVEAAAKSRDRSTQVGAVIVSQQHTLRSLGWNDFAGNMEVEEWMHQRPQKYTYTVHAESAAILRAAARGISIAGCTLFTTKAPCGACALQIAQAGVVEVVTMPWNDQMHNPLTRQKWVEASREAQDIFRRTGVTFRSV